MIFEMVPTKKRQVFYDSRRDIFVLCGDEDSDKLAVTAGPLQVGERLVPFISLVKVTKRMALYREPMVPRSYGSMNPRQQ